MQRYGHAVDALQQPGRQHVAETAVRPRPLVGVRVQLGQSPRTRLTSRLRSKAPSRIRRGGPPTSAGHAAKAEARRGVGVAFTTQVAGAVQPPEIPASSARGAAASAA